MKASLYERFKAILGDLYNPSKRCTTGLALPTTALVGARPYGMAFGPVPTHVPTLSQAACDRGAGGSLSAGSTSYKTRASKSGRITTLSCSFGSVRAPTKTAGVALRLTATWGTPDGMYR